MDPFHLILTLGIDLLDHLVDVGTDVLWVLSGHRSTDWVQCVYDQNDWLHCITGPAVLTMGMDILATLLVTGYAIGLWQWSDSLVPPAVAFALFGPTLILPIEGPVARAVGLLVTLGLATAYYAIFER